MDELVGFSRTPEGRIYPIGIGPLDWLQRRVRPGCELMTRQPVADDYREPTTERDLRITVA